MPILNTLPVRAEALFFQYKMLLPLQGVNAMANSYNRVSLRLPWATRFWAFSPCLLPITYYLLPITYYLLLIT